MSVKVAFDNNPPGSDSFSFMFRDIILVKINVKQG